MHAVNKTATTPSGGLGALGELKAEHGFKAGVSGAHTARTMMLAGFGTHLALPSVSGGREAAAAWVPLAPVWSGSPGKERLVERFFRWGGADCRVWLNGHHGEGTA